MSAYANAGATPFPAASHTGDAATPYQHTPMTNLPSTETAGGQMDTELGTASPSLNVFSSRFNVNSAPDVNTCSPSAHRLSVRSTVGDSNAVLVSSPYPHSEISFATEASPHTSSKQAEYFEEEMVEADDRWQMDASTSNSPISYITAPVANRLGSKVHASPSYDPRYA